MFYLRPGMSITFNVAGNFPDLASGGGTITNDSVSVEGNDVTVTGISTVPGFVFITVEASENAVPGVRDVRIAYSDSNAVPVVAKNVLTVLKVGCLGSQIWFWMGLSSGMWPTGMPSTDETNADKMWLAVAASPYNPPRLWQWDFGDMAGSYGTALWPRWDYTDPATGPNVNETVQNGRESGNAEGYLTGSLSDSNLNVDQWNTVFGSKAYACAPDEFIEQDGINVPEQRWTGFPDPNTRIRNMNDIPKETFFRKPHFYMSTGDHFWNNEGIAHPTENQSWCGNGGAGQSRLTALPMWARGTGSTFDNNYTQPFWRMRRVEQGTQPGTSFCGYNDDGVTTPNAQAKGIMMLSIEPIECVLPGPQTRFPSLNNQDEQNYTYRRRGNGEKEHTTRGRRTMNAKIKILYQDLFAFSDYYNGGGGGVNAGVHKMSDPIVLAEAYCPRIDVTYDYDIWDNDGQPIPNNPAFKSPQVQMESQPFVWKQIITDSSQVEFGESEHPDGGGAPVTGDYLNSHKEEIALIAEYFIKEFDGYACKLKVPTAYWCPNAVGAGDSQCFGINLPAGRTYGTDLQDREGTFLAVAGYLEVVEK